jgi:hypothetical protein
MKHKPRGGTNGVDDKPLWDEQGGRAKGTYPLKDE